MIQTKLTLFSSTKVIRQTISKAFCIDYVCEIELMVLN